jgi:hypothetical protein
MSSNNVRHSPTPSRLGAIATPLRAAASWPSISRLVMTSANHAQVKLGLTSTWRRIGQRIEIIYRVSWGYNRHSISYARRNDVDLFDWASHEPSGVQSSLRNVWSVQGLELEEFRQQLSRVYRDSRFERVLEEGIHDRLVIPNGSLDAGDADAQLRMARMKHSPSALWCTSFRLRRPHRTCGRIWMIVP